MAPQTSPLSSIDVLVIDGLSAEQAAHVQQLLQARGVLPEVVGDYVADLTAVIEAAFDSYFDARALSKPENCNTNLSN